MITMVFFIGAFFGFVWLAHFMALLSTCTYMYTCMYMYLLATVLNL